MADDEDFVRAQIERDGVSAACSLKPGTTLRAARQHWHL